MAQFPSTTSASDVWNVTDVYRAVAGGNWPSVPVADPYFPYVTMLLPGNGTNGAQNNTFLDSSASPLTITRNGNTTQGTFSPYGSNWSNFFDGSGDYLSLPSNSAFTLGTGDFTIEMWYNPSVSYASGNVYLYDMGSNGTRIQLYLNTIYFIPQSGNNIQSAAGVGMVVGTWYHVAAVRSGSTMTLYVNGASVGSTTNSNNLTDTLFRIGDYGGGGYGFNGSISNVRVVKGTAIYTSAFTPSTTPLTAVSGTSLLTCQSNRFIDNSTNNFAVTPTGNTSVQRFSPFSPTASYSTSVIGGSGYFDGTGDYLTAPDNAAWDLGSNNFTIESWVYPTASPAQPMIIGQWTSSYSWTMQLSNDGNRYLRALLYNGSFNDYVSSTSLQLNAWNHCAFVRESNTVSLYLNGARVYTTTFTGSVSTSSSAVSVGGDASGSQPFQGYLSNISVVNGTALYSGTTYTVPTAPSSVVANTKLLLSTTNAGIIDNAMMNNLETVGNAQISTAVSKFGGGSMAFDGSGDWLVAPSNAMFNMGTGNFTIECWAYPQTQVQTYPALFNLTGTADLSVAYNHGDGTANSFSMLTGGTRTSASVTSSVNAWYHIAIVRNGTTVTLYIDGTSRATTTNSSTLGGTTCTIGVYGTAFGTTAFKGYIDDLRITNGYARYTSNFTPPTEAFPTF